MTDVQFFDPGQIDDRRYHFVTAAVRYRDKWVFSRHKQRTTWDMPGGHREAGETVEAAMGRELGALQANIQPVCAYVVNGEEKCGMLFFANITQMGELPPEFEMAETILTDKLPENLTYPEILPALFTMIQGWLNLQSNAEELWDVYDADRKLTGKLHRRGDLMKSGEYHLVVDVWMLNSEGQFLLTKRSPNKGFPNMWESTGGSALAGDDSLTAALREVKEETGLELDVNRGELLFSTCQSNYFRDVWLFRQDFDLQKVILQPGETVDKMYAAKENIQKMYEEGQFVPYGYLEELFEAAGL